MKKGVYAYCIAVAAFIGILAGVYMYRNHLPAHGDGYSVSQIVQEQGEIHTWKVSINTATAEELQKLPGIGPSIAGRIVAYREANGPFTSVNELENIKGISRNLLNSIIPYITTGG